MSNVVFLESYIKNKIKFHRDQMEELMACSRALVDLAVTENKKDFSKIDRAARILDGAVKHSTEIKRLEIVLQNHEQKANPESA